MSDLVSKERKTTRLLTLSLNRPVLVMLMLFLLASFVRIIDTIVFRLDELIGEAILSKALGFLLVAVYVWACGRKLRDIGFHTRFLSRALLIAFVGFGIIYILAFTAQIVVLRSSGENASLVLSAIDPKTGMSGGLLFAIWLLAANLVNSAMEEGLFRGAMIRHFLLRFSGWGAILLQAGLFALWHMNWPARLLLDGEAGFGQAASQALSLLVATSIAGIAYGYLYLKTDNLWAPFLAHTINNGIFNVLFIRTSLGMQSGVDFGLFIAMFLVGFILMIPVIRFASKRLEMPEVKPWGQFDRIVEAFA